ncbi:hypothetical protein CY35_12G050900 [Sphagnum magellanicum]|nr:hypothetical protein CY35_12G050900 [Sphagnum magellanicum]
MAVALLPQTPWRVVVLSRGSTALFPSRIPLPHVSTRNPLHTGFASRTKEWRSCETRAGIHIDRRRHFDELWRRQEEGEAREAEAEVTCPIDCVREVRNLAEFERVLLNAESANQLVVVDFYNSSCGACKYILPQFIKLCKGGCGEECHVEHEKSIHFVKHNVHDEYDDLTVRTLHNFIPFDMCPSSLSLWMGVGWTSFPHVINIVLRNTSLAFLLGIMNKYI